MRWWKIALGVGFASALALGPTAAMAAPTTNTVRVSQSSLRDGYPSNPSSSDNLWYRMDTRVGGGVTLVKPGDTGNPIAGVPAVSGLEPGSLALTTNNTDTAKAQLLTTGNGVRGTPLASVTDLSYWTYQVSGSPTIADASWQLVVDTDGNLNTTSDETTLVWEAYNGNDTQQAIVPDQWQFWDTTNGNWWSSRAISCNAGAFTLAAGHGGPPFTTPNAVALGCPGAVVAAIGVNVGSSNAGYTVAVDGVHFQTLTSSTTWDFGPK
jgi:hypothetical protein